MVPENLALRTDLMLLAAGGAIVTDRGDYLRVESPHNPTFYWGNYLVFQRAPTALDVQQWPALFTREFAHMPDVQHVALQWDSLDGEPGALQDFVAKGFEREKLHALSTGRVSLPARPNDDVSIRVLTSDDEWNAVFENVLLLREPDIDESDFRRFARRRLQTFRAMVAAGSGQWHGAFIEGALAASLGLFWADGLGRFQEVITHPDFRRQGICTTLVSRVSREALATGTVERLVMVATDDTDDYHAAAIYRSLGFEVRDHIVGVVRKPQPSRPV